MSTLNVGNNTYYLNTEHANNAEKYNIKFFASPAIFAFINTIQDRLNGRRK
jgi:hypothetical protein